ncbi:hypothetical protein MLD38_023184 [Melastoma candidum]|uniref:Uncharacterized protein n=1 Tax=Melastoma candidum TaxID=119954 RepID=A0ACB9QQ63_9MYRT|nr:hypothetical protein MLD38_023184 [Melastoma candidum]
MSMVLPIGFSFPSMNNCMQFNRPPFPFRAAAAATASLQLGPHLGRLLAASFENLIRLNHVPRLKNGFCSEALLIDVFGLLHTSNDAFPSVCLHLFHIFGDGEGARSGTSGSRTPMMKPPGGRGWTNVILALNILMYIGQVATEGKLLYWGAKINSLIEMGQWWRLATASVLHANAMHLMVNCYSLNSIGPSVETMSGARRFLTIYFTSAIASSVMSLCMSKAPAVGASGAIFGLVGSTAVFILRHRSIVGGSTNDLKHIANVIVLNLAIGLLSPDIDNWGHLGGLLGGAITSWFIGPAWKYEAKSFDGRRVFVDRAPVFRLIRGRNPRRTK